MLKTFTLTVAIGAMVALFGVTANAAPISPSKQITSESNVLLVRDGCGRGMRFSHGRNRCVEQFESRRRMRRDDCRRGQHFSHRLERCVWDRSEMRHHRNDADAAGIIGAILGGQRHGRHQQPGADGQDD